MNQKNKTEQKIRNLLSEITLNQGFLTGAADANLHEMGLDSVGMIELVYGLEARFDIEISDDEVLPENFASIASLVTLVETKNALV